MTAAVDQLVHEPVKLQLVSCPPPGAPQVVPSRVPMEPPTQQPSIGRVVHYVSRGSVDGQYPPTCRAATITEVDRELVVDFYRSPGSVPNVGLAVTNPTGVFFQSLADGGSWFDEGARPEGDLDSPCCGGRRYVGGSWHWPARV